MEMDLEELKQALRVDGNDLDGTLTTYVAAGETYLANAGVTKDYSNPLYKTTITIFCGKLLENPSLLSDVKSGGEGIGLTLNGFIAQLRLSQVVTS